MWLAITAVITGLVILVWSADKFVDGAAALANNLGMSPLLIGLTIVSLGTSAPEIFVSANAALNQATDIAVGNAIGSNLANVGLVLAITALITPLPIAKFLLIREIPVLLLVTALGAYCVHDGYLDRIDAACLLGGLLLLSALLIYRHVFSRFPEPDSNSDDDSEIKPLSNAKASFWLISGLLLLLLSSDMLVWGARDIASHFGISELVIGLTIVAIGTSLPELAASVASALRGHHDIALGNVVGSNILNLLTVIPVAAVIHPSALEPDAWSRDYLAMSALTLILAVLLVTKVMINSDKARMGRLSALLLLAFYGAYYWVLLQDQAVTV